MALYTLDGEWARVAALAKTPLAGEIRLAWWAEAVECFAAGGAADHPALAALGAEAAQAIQPELQAVIDSRQAALESPGPSEAAEAAVMAAAARLLDPLSTQVDFRAAAHAFVARHTHALDAANAALAHLPAQAFPAVAHVTLLRCGDRRPGELEKRLRIVWAVVRGRL